MKSAVLSITQPLILNAMKHRRKSSNAVQHNLETPTLPGGKVLQLFTNIANAVIDQFEDDGVVCLSVLRETLFTTGNLDNLDHNPTSMCTSAQQHFMAKHCR